MKILMCHNYYQQPGGEDKSFAAEAELLESRGHEVIRYTRHNDDVEQMSKWAVARETLWSRRTYREIRGLVRKHRPQVMHCTNTFPLISPSAYYAARDEKAAVVQSLRNYRLLCPGAAFLRDGKACEDCLGKLMPWRAVAHKCYRGNRAASGVVAGMLTWHRMLGTWSRAVDMYYALTEFSRDKFIEGGLPAEKVAVKPNFLNVQPEPGSGAGGYAVFVGRLSPEKGLSTLLDAWSQMNLALPLKIVGDGPLAEDVRRAASEDSRIEWLGFRNASQLQTIVGDARFLIVPSIWYEGFPRTILEAFALGTPVVASRLGSMAEIIDHGRTGCHFNPSDTAGLIQAVQRLHGDDRLLSDMRLAARAEFEAKYSAEENYRQLIDIYDQALANAGLPPTGESVAAGEPNLALIS